MQQVAFCHLFALFQHHFAHLTVDKFDHKDFEVAVADDAEGLDEEALHELSDCHFLLSLLVVKCALAVDQILLRLLVAQSMRFEPKS